MLDATLLFRPCHFNDLMALQMTGSARELVLPRSTPAHTPDNGLFMPGPHPAHTLFR